MVCVVNKPILNKQNLCLAVSAAVLRLYRVSVLQTTRTPGLKPVIRAWTRQGQMKVVLKGNSGQELEDLWKKLGESGNNGLQACIMYEDEFKFLNQIPGNKKKKKEVEKNEPKAVILCILGQTVEIDRITGHLKLL